MVIILIIIVEVCLAVAIAVIRLFLRPYFCVQADSIIFILHLCRYYRRRTTDPMRLQLGAGLRQYPLTVR